MDTKTKMNTVLLISWIVVLVCDIASAIAGGSPTWIHVFCPLFCLIIELIGNYVDY
jgi:Na+/serine symporter